MESLSEVELNQIERAVHVAERDRAESVTVPTRALRALLSPAGSGAATAAKLEDAIKKARRRINSIEAIAEGVGAAENALDDLAQLLGVAA